MVTAGKIKVVAPFCFVINKIDSDGRQCVAFTLGIHVELIHYATAAQFPRSRCGVNNFLSFQEERI
jgi:hypothetical protein